MPGKCKFQDAWLSKAIYKEWLVKDNDDIHFARCRACCKLIKLQTMGEAALTSHAGGAGHKAAVCKLLEVGNLMVINPSEQRNGTVTQTEDVKERVSICHQHEVLDRIPGSDWSDMHHNPIPNSSSHNAELQDVAYPAVLFTAPGTSRLIGQRPHPSSAETEEACHHRTQHDSINLSTMEHLQRTKALEQQMKILEWENRMKLLTWEQELVRERRKAVQQKKKAFRMKKLYYKAKLKRMGEEVLPSSSSSDEEEKTSDRTG